VISEGSNLASTSKANKNLFQRRWIRWIIHNVFILKATSFYLIRSWIVHSFLQFHYMRRNMCKAKKTWWKGVSNGMNCLKITQVWVLRINFSVMTYKLKRMLEKKSYWGCKIFSESKVWRFLWEWKLIKLGIWKNTRQECIFWMMQIMAFN